MAEPDEDPDLIAAERALGLEPAGRETPREAEARARWEMRFAELARTVRPVDPPQGLFAEIEARIEREEATVLRLDLARARRSARIWRVGALAASVLAAALGIWGALGVAPEPQRYLAVVHADADPNAAGMVIHLDARAGTATVIPILQAPPPDASYEMWQLREGQTRPVSLGLLPEGPQVSRRIEAEPGDLFAISLEPPGGSPTGQPTQALYHGRVIAVSD